MTIHSIQGAFLPCVPGIGSRSIMTMRIFFLFKIFFRDVNNLAHIFLGVSRIIIILLFEQREIVSPIF